MSEEVRPSASSDPATEWERMTLKMDGLWSDDRYPEFGQDAVLHAYRLGYEDRGMG